MRAKRSQALPQESLQRVIEAVTSELELRPLLTSVVRYACELLNAERGTIGLVDENRQLIRTEAVYQMPAGELGAEMPLGIGLAGQVLRSKQPLLLNRYGDIPMPTRPEILDDAVLGVPIWWQERMIGFFGIGAGLPRQFDAADVETLSVFSRYAAIAIHNARQFEAERRRAARMHAISVVGQLMTRSLSLDEVLATAFHALSDQLDYTHLALFLVDETDPEALVLRARRGIYMTSEPGEYRQRLGEGVVGAAAKSRQVILVPDVRRDGRYLKQFGAETIQSELALPMMADGRLLGVLNVESEQVLDELDVEALGIVAGQLATAVKNAGLFEKEQRRVARVTTVGRVGQLITSSLTLDELLQTTVEAITMHLGYSVTGIFLADALEPSKLVLRARKGAEVGVVIGQYSQRIGEGNVGLAAERRAPVFVADVKRDPHYRAFPGGDRLKSELALPIVVAARLLGVLNVESETSISEDDLAGLEIITDQLGVAIDNARLFAKTEAALAEMQLLYETSRRISMAVDVQGVVEAYLEQVAMRGRYACSVVIFTLDDAGTRKEIVILGRWTPQGGLSHPNERHAYFQDGFDALLDGGQTVTIADVASDRRVSATLRQAQEAAGRPALALIPLMVRGRRIGSVSLNHSQVHAWSEADLRPYQVTAAQLAMAIYSRQQQQQLLAQEQTVAVLEERQRLSRELHDSVTQLIFSMTLIAQSIAPAMREDPAKGEARVDRLLELAQKARAEMRSLLVGLRPPAESLVPLSDRLKLQRDGLKRVLRDHLEQFARDDLMVRLDVDGYHQQAAALEEAFFRISQEALNNIVKHAHATRINLKLWTDDKSCHLVIEDNGRGFDPATPKDGHFGLETMRERIEALDGQLQIRSAVGEGTSVRVVAPLMMRPLE